MKCPACRAPDMAVKDSRPTTDDATVKRRLLRGDAVTKNGLMDAVYTTGIDDQPEIKIIDVFICKLRKKLKPFGIEIATIWGVGYQMTADSKALIDGQWPRQAAA